MVRGSKAVVGILAGGGSLPREIADVLFADGQNPVIVGLEGEVRPRDFAGHDFTLVNWGRIGQLLRTFKQKGVTDLVIVGSVTRPDLRAIRTDFGFWWNLPRIFKIVAAGGDDSVLRRVVGFFESHGLVVRGPADVAPALVIGEGAYGQVPMSDTSKRDFEIGREIVARLAPFDVGQAVVSGEWNGACDRRCGRHGCDVETRCGAAKRGARRRARQVAEAGSGVACRYAGDRAEHGCGCGGGRTAGNCCSGGGDAGGSARRHDGRGPMRRRFSLPGWRLVLRRAEEDSAAGRWRDRIGSAWRACAARALARRVVVRRHVLAVEAGEGLATSWRVRRGGGSGARAKGGEGPWRLRRSARSLDRAVITAAADAGYQCDRGVCCGRCGGAGGRCTRLLV